MTTPQQLPHEWSKDALLSKAQRYAEEMLSHPRESWQFAFWSSLALELLARAALGNVSPALLAESKDWNNLYFALGNTPTAPKFSARSIDITTVFSRLRSILPEFTPDMHDFGVLHMGRRNQEVHSGSTPFDSVQASTWLPAYYQSAGVLLESLGESLESFVGLDESKVAAALIDAANDASAKAVAKTIEAHKTVWAQKSAPEKKKLQLQATSWATKQAGHRVACPACSSDALVTGAPVAPPTQILNGDEITETQYFLPAHFECVACGLKIGQLSKLHAVGLAETFKSTTVYDAAEYYRENDPYEEYEPDFNEP